MKKNEITNYLKNDNKEIVNYIKNENINSNNDANKFKNILTELKQLEKEHLLPIQNKKRERYNRYKDILKKEQEIVNKVLFIKNMISTKLTEWNDSKLIVNKDNQITETKIFTNNSVKKYNQLIIDVVNIDEIPNQYIKKVVLINNVKKDYRENKKQIVGLKITEKEVIK